MTEKAMDQAAKVGAYLSRGVLLEIPGAVLPKVREEVREWELFWARKEKQAASQGGENDPAAAEYNQIRRFLKFFILPRLEELAPLSPVEQVRMLNLMTPFDSEGGLRDFLLHFFQLAEDAEGEMTYALRDPFERELYVLHDLYKVKKTQEVIHVLRKASGKYPSVLPPEHQLAVLQGLETVLALMYSQALPPEHREPIRRDLSPAFLTARQLLERRERDTLYLLPHVREKYDYRRFFFLVYLRDGLKAKIGAEDREYKYSYVQFQTLKREYLIHWLHAGLGGNEKKMAMFERYSLQGKTIRQWVEEHPEDEQEVLMQMPAPAFNDMIEQLNEQVAPEERVAFNAESEHFGLFHELKKQLHEAVELVKVPLETLRKLVQEDRSPAASQPAPPEPQPEHLPQGEPLAPPEPKWEVTLLKKGQIGFPYLLTSTSGFNARLRAIKSRLGAGYSPFADYTARLLEHTPEAVTFRRRTPKHEWTLPYHLRRILPGEEKEYLLVLGAEVKTKPLGMGYSAKESYNFSPYYVLGALEQEERLGPPAGERTARGKAFLEFDPASQAVSKFAMELLEIVKEKGQRK